MNKAILYPKVQEFILNNLKSDLTRLVLKGSPFPDVSVQELAQQIAALKTAEKKLPSWFSTENLIFPPKLNLEQTSSEVTARYKASLVSGKNMADLTGGFGIDSYFFSRQVEQLHYCELNEELAELAAHNFKILGAENIEVHSGNGLDFLRNSEAEFDWIYLDPARRDDHGGKVFRLADCTPDVPANLNLLFSRTGNIMVKSSPLLDLKAGIEELEKVAEIHIVAVNNEVKELIWLLEKIPSAETVVKTVNFGKKEVQSFEGPFSSSSGETIFKLPENFLYEPNAALMKSGLFDLIAKKTATSKLHPNSHLYTSEELQEFPGRKFQILDTRPFNIKELKKKFKLKKANITTRNFPDSVEKIRKKLKIQEGGDSYLFFTTNLKEEKIVLICRKVK
ncbi:MAG: class I SAM-dependent methyltransferase [Salegentibacter sp.]